MAAQLGLPAALAARGLAVEVVTGWETRSAGSFNPKGAVCHWTAGPAGSKTRPSLNICTNGRSDLPGPLCNVYLDRNGIAVVVSANRANHAGTGSWKGLTGNSAAFGTEAEAAGPTDFTDAQRWAYPRINAAYADLGKFGADMVCGHSEWAGSRKTDINDYPMTAMRTQVAALLAGGDDFDMATGDEILNVLKGYGRRIEIIQEELLPAMQTSIVGGVINGLLDTEVARPDDRGPTTLRGMIAWNDNHVDALASAIAAAASAGPVDASAVRQLVQDAVTSINVKITAD